ncbi:Phox-like protein [Nadsonia fulvescens var. elongata DSM 6958]|uniref:Endosomal/vacuolar adapter protein YPT35 n=1 Tax=Nadsonia fulvescens var. elongata DSM 6958 TaxID=857566 RepID=A0A1E3PQ01_9ASCO|nr:Phox-like protein [Nadsonia fulvescens var. elongata DSM 6958]
MTLDNEILLNKKGTPGDISDAVTPIHTSNYRNSTLSEQAPKPCKTNTRKKQTWRVGDVRGLGDLENLKEVPPIPSNGGIGLIDHTSIYDGNPANSWASSILIEDYSVVSGSNKSAGYVTYAITIVPLTGGQIKVNKRYREFYDLRKKLLMEFPNRRTQIPEIPPKRLIAKFNPNFLEHRRKGLEYFLMCILLNPAFASCGTVKKFVATNA